MLRSVFGKILWDERRALVAWTAGLTLIGVIYAAFFPLIKGPEYEELLKAWPPEILEALGFTEVTTAAGYLGAATFGLLGPIVMIFYATWLGTRAVAGDEETGRLDLLLAHPVSRWRVFLERLGAMIVGLLVAPLALFVALLAIAGPAQLESVSPANMAAGAIHLAVFGFFFGALALGLGAATGRRSAAFGAVAIAGIGGYIANALAPLVEGLDWLRRLSPFYYHAEGKPLSHGIQAGDLGVLLLVAALLLLVGGLRFDRRDIGV